MPHFNSSEDAAGVEEERRLAYVAMTRARHVLHLSYAASRRRFGVTKPALPSRFLDALPANLLLQERGGYTAPPPGNPWGSARGLTSGFGGSPREARRPVDEVDAWSVDDVPDYEGESQEPGEALRKGSRVFHTKFGEGRVLEVEGQGERGKAKVIFADGVTRKLIAGVLTLV